MTPVSVTPVAAIDCGTNSTRLLVVGSDGETVAREMVITRLGEGVDREHRLSPEAIARTVAVLDRYRVILDQNSVTRVRMTATSAARDAINRDDFFAAATRAIGVAPELLSGEQEGQLSFAGAVAGLAGVNAPAPFLVADIGGGSTELAAGPSAGSFAGSSVGGPVGPPRAAAVCSLDVGCVRLTERYLHHDPPLPQELATARTYVRGVLEKAFAEQPALGEAATLIGLAGTVAALAAIEQGLDHYVRERVHHYRLSRRAVEQILEDLAAIPAAERRKRAGVEADRADVIVGGAAVLAELMAVADQGDCLTSESDILDGLAQSVASAADELGSPPPQRSA